MATKENARSNDIDRFFAGPGSRADRWRDLVQLAEAWAADPRKGADVKSAIGEMIPTEEFHAYPGTHLLAALQDHAAKDDARELANLARRITRALLTKSYRHTNGSWKADESDDELAADVLPPTLSSTQTHRPYFEVLIVTGASSDRWPSLASEWRRLRRPQDPFIYEPVFVGSFEDAFCAAILNPDLAAVVIHEGFAFR